MDKRSLIVYVSGHYSTGNIAENIQKAREAAIAIWEAGYTALCPHLNTAHFEKDCTCEYEDYMEGDIELLDRCDAIFMLDGWEDSNGAQEEHNHALIEGLPVAYTIEQLNEHFKDWE